MSDGKTFILTWLLIASAVVFLAGFFAAVGAADRWMGVCMGLGIIGMVVFGIWLINAKDRESTSCGNNVSRETRPRRAF